MFQREYQTLRSITEDIHQMADEIEQSDIPSAVENRGFCLPEEDNWIKRVFATYANHRKAVLGIIYRHEAFAKLPVESASDSFLIGFAGALLLCRWSSVMIHTFKDMPCIKAKLNEGDAYLGLEENLFNEVYRNLTRVNTQERLAAAAAFFEFHHEKLASRALSNGQAWLIDQIELHIKSLSRSSVGILKNRVARGVDLLGTRSSKPFKDLIYLAQSKVFDIFGNIWFEEKPDIPIEHQKQFLNLAEPGDFFIVRPELKSSTIFLPGWWTHGAVYFGGADELKRIGADVLPPIQTAWPEITRHSEGQEPVTIIEALSAGVVLNPLKDSMHVDQAVLLRPRFTPEERLAGLNDVFANLGKPYDFSFDFSRSDRLVCTEVIYRGYDGKGPVRFRPQIRLGNPTLSADDIIDQVMEGHECGNPSIKVVALSSRDKKSRQSDFYHGADALRRMKSIKK